MLLDVLGMLFATMAFVEEVAATWFERLGGTSIGMVVGMRPECQNWE